MSEDVSKTNEDTQKIWKRRGLFAAAAAAVAAVVAKVNTRVVEAANGGNVVIAANNTETLPTTISNSANFSEAIHAYCYTGSAGYGVYTLGSQYGVLAYATSSSPPATGAGGYGTSAFTAGTGVEGFASGLTNGNAGVRGTSVNGNGVEGSTTGNGSGVVGIIKGAMNGIGVYGFNQSTYAGATSGSGGFGFYGGSAKGHGMFGNAMTAGAGAVVGYNGGVAGCYGGLFYGAVVVQGDFTVTGAKSAAVPHPDGSHRRLYCVESPESWFEDFGKGQLACGEAEIAFDPDFAAVARTDDYHVFLTGYGDFELTVAEQTPAGFRVQAKNPQSNNRFSWRVVAKRKDIAGERFETVEIPRVPDVPVVEINTPEPPQPRASTRH
jgi:hypothetical protein